MLTVTFSGEAIGVRAVLPDVEYYFGK